MRSVARTVTMAILCLTAPAAAQGPRLSSHAWHAFSPPTWPSVRSAARVAAPKLAWPTDSASIRPTHWLEGALIGTVLVGLAGTGFCHLGDSPTWGCYALTFTVFGGAIGLPVGALIGGQFPVH